MISRFQAMMAQARIQVLPSWAARSVVARCRSRPHVPTTSPLGRTHRWGLVLRFIRAPHKSRFLLRPPHEILQVGFLDWDHFSEILQALWSSTRVALIGLAISIAIGFFLATIMSQTKIVERAIFPYMVMLQAIPILAIVPLIGFWWAMGRRHGSRCASSFPCSPSSLTPCSGCNLLSVDSRSVYIAPCISFNPTTKVDVPRRSPSNLRRTPHLGRTSVIGAIVGDYFFGQGAVASASFSALLSRLEGEDSSLPSSRQRSVSSFCSSAGCKTLPLANGMKHQARFVTSCPYNPHPQTTKGENLADYINRRNP